MTTAITGVHPYADKFPMLPESELQELAESILQNGLRQPIVLTEDGLILDGRNRAIQRTPELDHRRRKQLMAARRAA